MERKTYSVKETKGGLVLRQTVISDSPVKNLDEQILNTEAKRNSLWEKRNRMAVVGVGCILGIPITASAMFIAAIHDTIDKNPNTNHEVTALLFFASLIGSYLCEKADSRLLNRILTAEDQLSALSKYSSRLGDQTKNP